MMWNDEVRGSSIKRDVSKLSAILIAGPTASGKTDLALRLACRVGMLPCVIINADSMQVYEQTNIITACPTMEQMANIPHRLFAIVNPSKRFSVGHWLKAVDVEITRSRQAGLLPIFVGGTGLYFKALTQGLSSIPQIPEVIIRYWKAEADRLGACTLHDILHDRDPKMAAILQANDKQRIIRALSVLETTGCSLLDWWAKPTMGALLHMSECAALFLDPDGARLRERIGIRFDIMMKAGALNEVRNLKALNLDPSLPVMRAHGVRELLRYMDGQVDIVDVLEHVKNATWRYAKRQKTWFRHQMTGWDRIVYDAEINAQWEQINHIIGVK